MRPPIEERARAYVAKMEGAVAGSGGHNQTFYVACVLVQAFQLSESAAFSIMQEYNGRCSPAWSDPDLKYKVQSAANTAPSSAILELRAKIEADAQPGDRVSRPVDDAPLPPMERSKRPDYDPAELKRLAAPWNESVGSLWLANRSAVDPALLSADGFLRVLYPEGENVVVFTEQRSQGQAMWPADELPIGSDQGVWFLPQPVDGKYHPNPRSVDKRTGKPKSSRRSMESVTAWRYMVLESDEAEAHDWMGLLVQMPLRVAAIYSSGKRSLHALIRVDRPTKASWDALKEELGPALNLLMTCGADPAALTAVRLSRLPQCWRGRKHQKLFYVNPDPQPRPLCEIPAKRDVESDLVEAAGYGISDADETGGQVLFDALRYYAAGSSRVREAYEDFKKLREEETE